MLVMLNTSKGILNSPENNRRYDVSINFTVLLVRTLPWENSTFGRVLVNRLPTAFSWLMFTNMTVLFTFAITASNSVLFRGKQVNFLFKISERLQMELNDYFQ